MNYSPENSNGSHSEFLLKQESERYNIIYRWLLEAMPPSFISEIGPTNIFIIAHTLIEFEKQEYHATIQLKNISIVLCLDSIDADLHTLKNYASEGITSYQVYISESSPPFFQSTAKLHIAIIHFFHVDQPEVEQQGLNDLKQQLSALVLKKHPSLTQEQVSYAMLNISPSFFGSLSLERLALAIAMFVRATTRDECQYEVHYNEEWKEKNEASMHITLAWRTPPKHNFLYRLLRTTYRHNLTVKRISSSHLNLYRVNSIFVLALDLHGSSGQAAWESTNILDFIKDLITVKYFASFDALDHYLVQTAVISENMANLLRAMKTFIHQALVHIDVNLYTLERIEEGLCRHPELTAQLCEAFKYRFDPIHLDVDLYEKVRSKFIENVHNIDTGHEENDIRRKNILHQGMNFIHHTLKTNFYRSSYTALSFRLDPKYLDEIPFDRSKKFPELPYAIFFIKGMHFFAFHLRFRDLSRGGLRTIFPGYTEKMVLERNTVFTECYNLAFTQQMKNKDIPEGGAKAVIFLEPYDRIELEAQIYKKELLDSALPLHEIDKALELFLQEQKNDHLYQAQRAFISNLIPLVNCDAEGKLKSHDIVDYWGKPEYLYLGPDENMHNAMIQWIANYSKKSHYKPGSSFISSKPEVGINHKEYGVTSIGVNVYLEAMLKYLNIDPYHEPFTIKMSGGPDGDVAGNEICNLYRFYPKTARLIALTDITGTIYDPEGLDLEILTDLFHRGVGIREYPPHKLHSRGFLLDRFVRRYQTPLMQQTLLWKKEDHELKEEWLSGSEMNHIYQKNVHSKPADIFIPAGGRPRTLNESNYTDFLDLEGKPTARAIIEGANLYLTPGARRALEELGVLVIKDSSANKTGVICSSFEVLCGLALGDAGFLENKASLVKEILIRLQECALYEARLLLQTHQETEESLTEISDRLSRRITLFKDQLLLYMDSTSLSNHLDDPLIKCFLNYCLPTLRKNYQKQLMKEIPEEHKKAIIASHVAAKLVYQRGLSWFPSVVDILPMLLSEEGIDLNSAL